MKRLICFCLVLCLCLSLAACGGQNVPASEGISLWTALLILLALAVLAVAGLRTWSLVQYNRRRKRNPKRKKPARMDMMTIAMYAAAVLMLLVALLTAGGCQPAEPTTKPDASTGDATNPSGTNAPTGTGDPTEPTQTQSPDPGIRFVAHKTENTDPIRWGIHWEVLVDGAEVESYTRQNPISFGDPDGYFSLPGVSAFRGNNYRNSPAYGTANVVNKTISLEWTADTKSQSTTGWTGCGWTGQPLIVRWDAETKSIMNLYPDKQAKEDLVEVIYACLDGHIYFLDLEDGEATRDPIYVGMCFKGSGSLDPRGYPILYVGAGDVNSSGRQPRFFIINLINGTVIYEHGNDDPLSVRRDNDNWCAFDSSPLVDAETDTLIWPGESGLLYTMKLNTNFNEKTGKLTVEPSDFVVTRYHTDRSGEEKYWYGYEASAVVVDGYLYISENGGMFYCIDLNTMELIWAQDTKDDSNASPVFEPTEKGGALYTAPSLHWTKDSNDTGTVSLYKLDAVTGEIIWEVPYDVHTVSGVSGGVQSSPLLGRAGTSMEGLVIYSVSRTPSVWDGVLVALNTETGEKVWELSMKNYGWSSPVAVYDENGNGYVFMSDFGGNAFFLDGATGAVLDTLDLQGRVEASPSVYENMLVIGTRDLKICGVKIG